MQVKWTKTDDWHIARFRSKNLDDCAEEWPLVLNYIEALPPGSKLALSFRGVEWIPARHQPDPVGQKRRHQTRRQVRPHHAE